MSRPIIRLKLDVTKIVKEAMFRGKKGVYLDVALFDSPKEFEDGTRSDGFATQGLSKERRDAGEKGAILGSWSYVDQPKQAPPPPKRDTRAESHDHDAPESRDIPF